MEHYPAPLMRFFSLQRKKFSITRKTIVSFTSEGCRGRPRVGQAPGEERQGPEAKPKQRAHWIKVHIAVGLYKKIA
jgi:hypothetical protein